MKQPTPIHQAAMLNLSDTLGARAVRGLCVAGGVVCVGLAALGLILPLLPTTPFLLLAAALFLRGSGRLYGWLLHNRYFGRYIRDYRDGRGIPRRAKVVSILMLWLTIGATLAVAANPAWVQLVLVVVAVGVTTYLARLPIRAPLPQAVDAAADPEA